MEHITIPYSIGTYLRNKDGRIDKLKSYIYDKDGFNAVLIYDALGSPYLSSKISIDVLKNNWIEEQSAYDSPIFGKRIILGMTTIEDIISNEKVKVKSHY